MNRCDFCQIAPSRQAVADGFTQIKLKVGADTANDVRRMALARNVVGPDIRIAVDANQRWEIAEAQAAIAALAPWDPYWVEEPTSPDEILGLAKIGARSAAEVTDALRLRALDIPAALWDSLATADERGQP